MNPQAIRAILKEKRIGTYEGQTDGCLGDLAVSQVWVRKEGEVDTCFVLTLPNNTTECLENFTALCQHLERESPDSRKAESELQIRKFSSYIAAFVFLMAVSTAIYIVTTQNDIKIAVVPFFLGLIASGGALFFGRWTMPSTR